MKNISIEDIWKQNELVLENSRILNLSLLKEVKTDKAKSSLKRLLFLPISTMLFFLITASYAMYFIVENLDKWYFVFSGSIVVLFSILYVASSLMQLKRIISVDYNAPVLKLQEDISKIKTAVVLNLRIAAWLFPFAPFIGLFLAKAVFNFDLTTLLNYNMITTFGIITILLEIVSLLLLRALRSKNINKKWLNWLLQGSGSQVDEAFGFIKQIEEFETEK
jgi:hypothetical protein